RQSQPRPRRVGPPRRAQRLPQQQREREELPPGVQEPAGPAERPRDGHVERLDRGGRRGGRGTAPPAAGAGAPPEPRQLHEDYSHRLHRNQVAGGAEELRRGRGHGAVSGLRGGARGGAGGGAGGPDRGPDGPPAVDLLLADINGGDFRVDRPGHGAVDAEDRFGELSLLDNISPGLALAPWPAHHARRVGHGPEQIHRRGQRQQETGGLDRPPRQGRVPAAPAEESQDRAEDGRAVLHPSVLYSAVWFLIFMSMLMSVLRLDLNVYSVQPYIVIAVMALLGVVSGTLIYIVHGHQVGYYKLTDAQLTAGVFYATSSFLAVLVVSIMADALSLPDLIQVDLLIVIVLLSPVVVILGGLGAYFVSRDEYDRLLEHGGQNAVVPMDLVLEQDGWTSVLGRGTVQIPLFGDVEYAPLGPEAAEAAGPCCCYPTVRAEEGRAGHGRLPGARNYQSPAPPGSRMEARATWGGSEAPIV
ncbi:hypothetical protein THAOC_17079, partial [Thalassiosira oceanica]